MSRVPHSSIEDYWVSGYGLSRQIVLRQIQYFLGPTASVRPYTHKGREGYLIRGTRLTSEQIEDLKRQSREYERQQSIRMSKKTVSSDSDPDINEPVVLSPTRGRRGSPGHSSSYHPYR